MMDAAGYLHDELGPALMAAGMELDLLRMDVETGDPALAARIAAIQKRIEDCFQHVRYLTSQLQAPGSPSDAT
jgi:signal transduction histidine kinase